MTSVVSIRYTDASKTTGPENLEKRTSCSVCGTSLANLEQTRLTTTGASAVLPLIGWLPFWREPATEATEATADERLWSLNQVSQVANEAVLWNGTVTLT